LNNAKKNEKNLSKNDKILGLVIQTTEGRKNLGNINVDAFEVLRFTAFRSE